MDRIRRRCREGQVGRQFYSCHACMLPIRTCAYMEIYKAAWLKASHQHSHDDHCPSAIPPSLAASEGAFLCTSAIPELSCTELS